MTGFIIPHLDLARQYRNLKDELLEASDQVYSSGKYLLGPKTEELEELIAKRCNRKYAVAVNSCSQALWMSLIAMGNINVVMPNYSYIATLNSVTTAGLIPNFVDVDYSGTMTITDLANVNKINSTVLHVGLFGNLINYKQLLTIVNKEQIIEDAAQSFGSRLEYDGQIYPGGSLGEISCLSFDPTKVLSCNGSGGMILTDNYDYYRMFLNMRSNNQADRRKTHHISTNSKISEVDAAHLIVKLKYFDEWQTKRQLIADRYHDEIIGTGIVPVAISTSNSRDGVNMINNGSRYVILMVYGYSTRDSFIQHMYEHGISIKVHYPYTLDNNDKSRAHNMTTWACSFPIYPEMTDEEVDKVIYFANEFEKKLS